MYPILVSLGSLHVYAFSVFLVVGWLSFSFFFWRTLRRFGVDEDKIFDATFYATVCAFVVARASYVLSHWHVFAGKSPLLTVAVWVAPGFSWLGGLIAGVGVLLFVAKRTKVRLGLILDACAIAIPVALIFGHIGSLFDGTQVGKPVALPWAVSYIGHEGLRHPIQVYALVFLSVLLVIMYFFNKQAAKRKWPYGIVGVWFFLLYSMGQFALEYFTETHVYWLKFGANQWILIGIFAESVGALFVRGRGKQVIKKFGSTIYEEFSRRHTHKNKTASG